MLRRLRQSYRDLACVLRDVCIRKVDMKGVDTLVRARELRTVELGSGPRRFSLIRCSAFTSTHLWHFISAPHSSFHSILLTLHIT